ncbi:hypothetical protein BJB45_13980 [Halomonas huangheensis]|uniref:Uncharacterized protein n=1 Tax=Halomonas huangheensis TaxID=1178482 RepID=W1N7N8_9GAMM|nr:hypothetical protein BJB45_13980 [Halomonas huangheensis]
MLALDNDELHLRVMAHGDSSLMTITLVAMEGQPN